MSFKTLAAYVLKRTVDFKKSQIILRGVLILYSWMGAIGGTFESIKFEKITPQHCGPQRLNSGWVDKSRSSCAARCLARFGTCHGFMYNEVTKLCTPSSGLSAEQSTPSKAEGDFYFSDSCQSYPDFRTKYNQSTQAHVAYYSSPPVNYTNAKAACECMNSHLYVANTLEKWWLINAIVNIDHHVFIGLDDMAQENKFVWADSHQEISSALKIAMFYLGQPDDSGGQDCVWKKPHNVLLDDVKCSEPAGYICEKTLC
ncbi:unnamed protein product [Lymnaea stagnalis]|uniref:C-type lectin domain-containing protein n=1 Tax=Lymnaea stagnalis TaxID=6523 RepID=A0AAV2HQJ9_LYMST